MLLPLAVLLVLGGGGGGGGSNGSTGIREKRLLEAFQERVSVSSARDNLYVLIARSPWSRKVVERTKRGGSLMVARVKKDMGKNNG